MNARHPLRESEGYILLLALIFFAIFFTMATALISVVVTHSKSASYATLALQGRLLAEAGIEQAFTQLNQNPSYTGETDTALGAGTFTVMVVDVDSGTKQVTATAYIPNSTNPVMVKSITARAGINSDIISFRYGIQAGNGGFSLFNSSTITGNAFSSGPVIGDGNLIYGDIVSTGATGLIYGIHATGTVYAHTLGSAAHATVVDKDAYYVTKTNTTVTGVLHPGSPDIPPVPLPISDAQITIWEGYAALGGTITTCDNQGNYVISGSMSLGPKKIACNLVVKSASGVLTVTGPLWVTGNIKTQTGPTIRMDPALGSQNVAIIADNPADTTGSGTIIVGQSTVFQGSGAPGSFVFLISQNNSAEQGGTVSALDMSQGASALVAYAAHGLLTLSQSVSVKEATGYKIVLTQSANVTYDTGLPSAVFESGPGASWAFLPGSYSIIK